jgi:hypothetical protein
MERTTEHDWIADRLAVTEPHWEPDVARARTRLRQPPPAHRRRAMVAASLAVAAVVMAFASPYGRAGAKELWYRWFVTRVAVVRVDLSKVPLDTSIRLSALQEQVSRADAAARIGFAPSLPPDSLAGGEPALSIVGRVEMTQRIHTGALEAALAGAHATDVEVPAEWNGVSLRAVIGPMLVARYPGDVEIVQTAPIRLEMPAGFPLERFAEVAFRAGGLPWREARQLAEDYARQPAWLLDVPADAAVLVETVSLPGGGSALLIEDPNERGSERATVLLSRPTRLFSVSSPDRELSLRMADLLR